MGRKSRKKGPSSYQNLTIIGLSSLGYGIGKTDEGKVVFVEHAAPNDVVDVRVVGRKKRFLIGKIEYLRQKSPKRVNSVCAHAGICGGCKWQHIDYQEQLYWKLIQVKDAFEKIGKIPFEFDAYDIIPSEDVLVYRNKMDFSFTDNKWLTEKEMGEEVHSQNGIGLHIPGRFDKVLHIDQCWLQNDYQNQIRAFIFEFAVSRSLSFFNLKTQDGLFRSMILRNNTKEQWMLILVVTNKFDKKLPELIDKLAIEFEKLRSIYLIENTKANDSIFDLSPDLVYGEELITEKLGGLTFQIRPKSFFQVNIPQAEQLFKTALAMVDWSCVNLAYDIYCGTGTITLLAAKMCNKVVGIESVQQAIHDAENNAKINQMDNVFFECGEARKVLTDEFALKYPKPDLIITDPPRAGMHPDVIKVIKELKPQQLLYISCNPATQARDINLMLDLYSIKKIRGVDMFPQTPHIENITYLQLK